jgi:hypothetical protein
MEIVKDRKKYQPYKYDTYNIMIHTQVMMMYDDVVIKRDCRERERQRERERDRERGERERTRQWRACFFNFYKLSLG